MNVLSGAASAFLMDGRAMIVELQRYADDVITVPLEKGRDDGGIDPARHGDDDTSLRWRLREPQAVAAIAMIGPLIHTLLFFESLVLSGAAFIRPPLPETVLTP
jgi:hypothetical protein